MEHDEMMAQFAQRQQAMSDILTKVDMTTTLFDQVVERTENFREGFYSHRKISDLSKTFARELQDGFQNISTPEDFFRLADSFIQNMENVLATLMSEMDRIEKMS